MFSRSVDVLVADLTAVDVDESVLSVAELGYSLDIAMSDQLPEYLAAQTWLRRRLAEYLGVGAGTIEFGSDDRGKPLVASPVTDLTFSFAHSDWTAVLAVGFRSELGVQTSGVTGIELPAGAVTRSLAATEQERFDSSINPVRTFLQFMTRKEALVEATGGVDRALSEIDASGLSPVTIDGWEITDLNLGDACVAAVAHAPGMQLVVTLDDTTIERSARFTLAAASV